MHRRKPKTTPYEQAETIETKTPISIIIPVYRGGEKFQRSYLSALSAISRCDELIIVVDGNAEGTPLPEENERLRIYQTGQRSGPAAARNLGAQKASCELLFFMDADVTINADAIQKIREYFHTHRDVAAVIGSYDDAPGEKNFLSQYRNLLHHYVHQNGSPEASTFWGACGAIRREVFLKLGGFDANRYLLPAIEDIELGYRLKAAGYRIRLLKDVQVKHLKRWDAFSIIKTDLFQRAIPWTTLILQENHLLNDLNTNNRTRFSIVFAFLMFILLPAAILHPVFFGIFSVFTVILFLLNREVYSFFRQKRGLWFALRTIPWHWLYFLYSGLGFLTGSVKHMIHYNEKVERNKNLTSDMSVSQANPEQ